MGVVVKPGSLPGFFVTQQKKAAIAALVHIEVI